MLSYLVIIPLLAIVALNLPFKKTLMNPLAYWLAVAFVVAEFVMVFCPTYPQWSAQHGWISNLLKVAPTPDALSSILFLTIGLVAAATLLVARYWIHEPNRLFLFSNLVLLNVAGMNGIVLSSDLFSLYVFLELTAVSSFVLIAFDLERPAFEGAFKYFLLSAFATLLLLSSIAVLFMLTGSTAFITVAIALRENAGNPLLLLTVGAFVTGLAIKAGLVPFHGWVPDAYTAAPAPTSVLLAGIVTKTTGVYTLIRVTTQVLGLSTQVTVTLLALGTLSLVAGALLALVQRDLKRMLAYSSISQVGYIILGLGAGTPLGIAGAAFHLFNHAVFKTLLFINASAVERETGTRDMDSLGGLSKQMPITGATSVIGLLSTAGIPPLSGFWSKLMIVVAVWQAGFRSLAIIAIVMSLLTLAYFLSMQRRVFFGRSQPELADVREATRWGTVPAVILAVVTIVLGLTFPWLFQSFLAPVRSFL